MAAAAKGTKGTKGTKGMNRTADGTVYDLYGPSGAPLVVLIHGLGLNRDVWAQAIPALCADYRVLVYDILGHGETPPPTIPANPRAFVPTSDRFAGRSGDTGGGPRGLFAGRHDRPPLCARPP